MNPLVKFALAVFLTYSALAQAQITSSKAIQKIPSRAIYTCTVNYVYTDPVVAMPKPKLHNSSQVIQVFAPDEASATLALLNKIEARINSDGDDLAIPVRKLEKPNITTYRIVDFNCDPLR